MTEKVLALMGPTAAGKSSLAEALAEQVDGELISVDSALVYRGLSIGAAKPDYPHHLVHIRDPADVYTAADFARDAKASIADIRARGRKPILVGGSMLYFRALVQGFDPIPAIDSDIRTTIEAEAKMSGWPALHEQLTDVDPTIAAQIHPNHSQRIGRALEVFRGTGVALSEWQRGETTANMADYECIALCPEDRGTLHARIAARLDAMFAAGLVAEVQALYQRGDLHTDLPSMRAVGYRQVWSHLNQEITLDECREKILAATRQLAKRQLTWLRSWPDLSWLLTDASGQIVKTEARDSPSSTPDEVDTADEDGKNWLASINRVARNF
jgi:tRNA dimethylallyltransferase